jgi:CTP:molybdopterin cytidylyltransferase MocA
MRILIIGTREYPEPQYVEQWVARLATDDVIVTRGVNCAERVAIRAAKTLGIQVIVLKAVKGDKSSVRYRDTALLSGKALCFCEDRPSAQLDTVARFAETNKQSMLYIGPDGHILQ